MIHKYELNGYYIVLDVNSGAVHVVDKLVYTLLDYVDENLTEEQLEKAIENMQSEFNVEDIKDAFSDLKELKENEELFTSDDYEQFANMMVNSPIKAMCLHIAHDCNLRCKYCFASTGDFGQGRLLMSEEVGKKAIDFLIANSGTRHNLELDFFGGEPLMNFDVVKKVVEYARSKEKEFNKNFRFTITTNGMLLDDDKIDFINKEMNNVVLSIDGRKEINDRIRVRVDGTGCYDTIMPNFKKMVEKRGDKEYYIRGTFTKWNKDFAEDVKHFVDEGFEQISVEPVVTDPKYPYALTEEDLPEIFAEYDKLSKYIIESRKSGKFFNFFHFMIDLEQGPCAIKRLRGCGCGNEYVAVTPDGDIYPCHQFVGKEEWKLGTLDEGKVDPEKKELFAKSNIYGKPECQKCWAKFYCSGGCNANNFEFRGDIHEPFKLACELEKKRVECAIMIKAALADSEN